MARWADRLCCWCMVSGDVNETVRLDSLGKHNCALPLDGPLRMQRVSSAMARTNQGKRPRVSTPDKRKQKAIPKQAQNKDFKSRFSNFLTRPWIIERGIDVESLAPTPVPAVVEDRRWGGYVARPPRPNRGVVAEYYASAVPKRLLAGGTVSVQGVEVHITPEAINQYFDAPEVAIDHGRGIEYIADLDQYRGRVAAPLWMDGQEEWGTLVKLYQRNTHADVAFWNLFLTYSLMPSQHRTEIFYDQARVLLRIRICGPINIGRAGIDVSAGLENHDPSMMNLTNWNQQLVLRGLPTIGNYGERRRRREEREAREAEAAAFLQDQPPEAPEAAQLGGGQPGGDPFATLLHAMQTHMDLRFGQLEGRIRAQFDTIETNIEELRGILTGRSSVASGSGVPFQTPTPIPDPFTASGSGLEHQNFDQRTPILNFDDEEPMQDDPIDSDQGTEILQLSDADGGD
ncbi:hypothetical protein LWI29_024265 [Acer saccharum]|uniref:Putative plant transposon protein domain-containing protein n=1 Tax=Acer saccharum TaxID=4024 RepID=A0AA39RNL3_ACESA|nr:hypothetical protein LWI29_024265 [Acer saccharum]